MAIFKCKMCGGTLDIKTGESVAVCEYCGTKQTLPKLDDDRKANLYDRANHFRRNNEFDKAMGIYENILNEDKTDSEAYWSLVLCRYGIEYVEDPASHKRVPTINRAQFTSIFDDEDYKSAIHYADTYQRDIYEAEAKVINEIQKGILEISQKEEPFDVFICYKDTDSNGRRTPDSVLATELYHELVRDGFKVFFSRITLETKLGVEYEPYIFAALNSAKVMVVLGTKPEHLNAVWVKNEWSRYLSLIKNGERKMLIPAYKDMDPYDLPEEFSHLQAQDMSRLGFMQDLVRGIKKITQVDVPKTTVANETVMSGGNMNTAPLLKRAFMFLEDGDWNSADEYCEKVLDLDPENGEAYFGKLLADLKVSKQKNLIFCAEPFDKNINYQKILRFADEKLVEELKGYIPIILERNEEKRKNNLYAEAIECYQNATGDKAISKLEEAIEILNKIGDWKDSQEKLLECEQELKKIKKQKKDREKKDARISSLLGIIFFLILVMYLVFCVYPAVKSLINENNGLFTKNEQISIDFDEAKLNSVAISAGENRTVALKSDGTVVATGLSSSGQCNIYTWTDIVAVSAGGSHIVGLKSDGTVVADGDNSDDVSSWSDIVAVSAGVSHTVGLKSDGTVVAVGHKDSGRCNVDNWTDIVAISAGDYHTVGLKSDGTVVSTVIKYEQIDYGQSDVEDWTDIVAISAGDCYTIGLKSDGTVVTAGTHSSDAEYNVEDWTDIVAVSAGYNHIVGLKSDGTVEVAGSNDNGECSVLNWNDIVAISASGDHTVGLKSDGTVVAVGFNDDGECDVSEWTDIKRVKV